jgi:hypothetical protein
VIYQCTLLVFGMMVLAFGAGVVYGPMLSFQPILTSTITFPCFGSNPSVHIRELSSNTMY